MEEVEGGVAFFVVVECSDQAFKLVDVKLLLVEGLTVEGVNDLVFDEVEDPVSEKVHVFSSGVLDPRKKLVFLPVRHILSIILDQFRLQNVDLEVYIKCYVSETRTATH